MFSYSRLAVATLGNVGATERKLMYRFAQAVMICVSSALSGNKYIICGTKCSYSLHLTNMSCNMTDMSSLC